MKLICFGYTDLYEILRHTGSVRPIKSKLYSDEKQEPGFYR